MPGIERRHLLGGLIALPFAAGTLFAGTEDQPNVSPSGRKFAPALAGPEVMRKRFFPNVPLVTHEGKNVMFYEDLLKGKIVVLNLMYADCLSLCPMITSNLLAAQKIVAERVKQDVWFYSFTIKPEHDTPEKLADYAKMHNVHKNWLFMTGKPADLEMLRIKLGYKDPDPVKDKDKALHSGMVRYGNEPLAQWSTVQGSANPEWIAEQITYVIPEAARTRIIS
ncbi:MAG TPA: SCO family protein [Thermoanaerobaculia bacterium]